MIVARRASAAASTSVLANLTFVCLMFEIMLCAPATVDHVSFWLYLVKCLWYALLGWLREGLSVILD